MDPIDAASQPQDVVATFDVDYEQMTTAVSASDQITPLDLVDQILAQTDNEKSAVNLHQPETSDTVEGQDVSDANTIGFNVTDCCKIPEERWKGDKCKEKSKEEPEQILKALSSLHSTEEKLASLFKKYADLMEEHRILQLSHKQSERKNLQVQKEKEQLQTEHSKAVLTRSRLESLCRELQRQNKSVKDESLMRVKEEEEKRKEVSAKFQTTFNEITNMMQDNNQKSSKLREENVELATKLKSLIDQYEAREQQVDKIIKHKDLEVQLADAKLARAAMEFTEEREKFLKDKHQCLQDLADYQKKCQELTQNEIRLRTQLNLYTDKYEEFQQTLSKSNEVFTHFKDEMDKMSKKIKKLEKETGSWRSRWESSNKALLEMATEKQHREAENFAAQKKILQLEKLCRALQTERQTLIGKLKDESSTIVENTECQDVVVATDANEHQVVQLKDINELENIKSKSSAENTTQDSDLLVDPQESTIADITGLPTTFDNNSASFQSKKEDNSSFADNVLPASTVETAEISEPRVQSKIKERNKKRNKPKQSN